MEKPTLEQFEKNFPEKSQMLQIEVIENIWTKSPTSNDGI